MGDVTDKGHDATEGEGADGEQNEGGLVIDGGTELSIVPVNAVEERNSFGEETAATQISDGIEDVKMAASQGNDTLYIGNICKLWTKELVLGALKSHGVKNIEDILLPGDTKKEGRIKGFALLEFNTHSDATAALERLTKPDVVFGLDSSANVAFAQTPIHPNQEVLSQLKTVFMEGLADSWDQEKVNGICKQYGEIVKVKLSRILGTKGKNFGYITFVSRESAIACVDGINNTRIGEGEIKVKASIAQPHSKGRLEKRGNRNQVVQTTNKETEIVNKAGSSEMRSAKRKGKILSETEFGGGGKPNKHVRTPSKVESANRKGNNQNFNAGGNGKKGSEHDRNRNSSKRQQGNKQTRQSENFRKPKRDPYIRKELDHGADFIIYKDRHAPGYPGSTLGHQNHVYNTVSGSKRPYADMEPHAGFIDPVNRKHGRTHPEYLKPPVGIQHQPRLGYLEHAVATHGQPRIAISEPDFGSHGRPYEVYLEPAVLTQSQPRIQVHEPGFGYHGRPHERYLEPAVRMHSHQSYAGYLEPTVRRQDQSHAGYYESALGKDGCNSYDLTLRRAGGQDGHGGGHSAYGAGSALPPSYVPNYTSYAPHEGGSTVGVNYQDSGVRLYQRAYQ
ncbi:uncharacterized protein LOC131300065 isoform X2 [Rhododendron vialii]|uniref:uncharacterized protein LOC131300065 isoform X2 n=1 Tax=Rhododendron vialii TaxID=182163 RepID=UPI00265ED2BC|nr:uncharacterized protein LOC131300065 isoform X2 [Rhododendron vialii]